MTETVAAHVQRAALDAKIELFTVDLTIYGGSVYHYVNDVHGDGTSVAFDSITYAPLPISSDGWQRSGRGTMPRPTITLSNVTGLFSYLNLLYDDLIGVPVTRTRTFLWALDGQPGADPAAILYPIDSFVIARKTHQDNESVQYELAAKMDLEGRVFPSRPMLQNACLHTYRQWNGSAFDYSQATCPYTGTVYRNRTGQVVPASQDKCAKTLPECLARFGVSTDLGFTGFPGIDRVRV